MAHRGHFKTDRLAAVAATAAAPQCGQCLLPMNNMPKHAGQATVANFDSQYWHCGASDEMAAPQFGQLRVCACMIKSRPPQPGMGSCGLCGPGENFTIRHG